MPPNPTAAEPVHAPDTVLVVDDQPANIRVLGQALAGMNLRVLTATGGAAALAIVRVLTHLIRDELPLRPDAIPGDLEAIEQTCDRLTQMVLGLIDISRMEQAAMTLERQPLDLGDLARDALRSFAAQAAAREI